MFVFMFRSGHGAPVDEFRPRAALGKAMAEGGGDTRDEGAARRCRDRRLRLEEALPVLD